MNTATAFLITAAYVGLASLLMQWERSSKFAFLAFLLIYLLAAAALVVVPGRTVLLCWLGFAAINIPLQVLHVRRQGTGRVPVNAMALSILFWPVQMAALCLGNRTARRMTASRSTARSKMGALPATITGTVSYTHHVDADTDEKSADMIWFEEWGDMEIFINARRFDALGVAEGRRMTFTVDERDGAPVGVAGPVLWVTGTGAKPNPKKETQSDDRP